MNDFFFGGTLSAPLCMVFFASDRASFEERCALLTQISGRKELAFAAVTVEDSNRALSPWMAPPVFGQNAFGCGAADTLRCITEELLPAAENTLSLTADTRYILGGYSLSGLFALWAGFETDRFSGIAAASPSVWFPKWDRFITSHAFRAEAVHLSIGDTEKKTRNTVLKTVEERLILTYDRLAAQLGNDRTALVFHPGNHFQNPEERLAGAFSWCIRNISIPARD